MELSNIPKDVILFVIAGILGVLAGYIHSKFGDKNNPIWPVKLYLELFKHSQPKILKNYAGSRNSFKYREQFMVASFVWFFIIFISLLFSFDGFRSY